MKQDYFKSYKYFKVIQLVVLVIFAVAFFCYLYFDETIHANIYTNKTLLTICIFLWAFMLYSLASIVWDFRQLEGNILHDSALHRAAYVDSLTGIPNRYSCDRIFEKYSEGTDISHMGCALISLSNLQDINTDLGRKQGNTLLRDFSHILELVGQKYGFIGRNGGNEFLFVMEDSSEEAMKKFISDIEASIDTYNAANTNSINISTFYILNEEMKIEEFTELIAELYNTAKRG